MQGSIIDRMVEHNQSLHMRVCGIEYFIVSVKQICGTYYIQQITVVRWYVYTVQLVHHYVHSSV